MLIACVPLCLHRFSSTCYLDSDGQPTCDSCAPGYSGRRCERCITTTPSFRYSFCFCFLPLLVFWTLLRDCGYRAGRQQG